MVHSTAQVGCTELDSKVMFPISNVVILVVSDRFLVLSLQWDFVFKDIFSRI